MSTNAYKTKLRETILWFLMEKKQFISAIILYKNVMYRAYDIDNISDATTITDLGKMYQSKRVSIQQCLSRMLASNSKRIPYSPLVMRKKENGLTYWKITSVGFQVLQKDLCLLPNSGIDVATLADPKSL